MTDIKITYLDPSTVVATRQTDVPRSGHTVSGYGSRIPTGWELCIGKRWHRVYVICYSNSGSAYIKIKGERVFLGSYEPSDTRKE